MIAVKTTDTVSAKLWKLSGVIVELVKKLQAEEGIVRERRVYVKPKFSEFEFKDGTISKQSWAYEYVEKDEWHWRDEFKFLENTVKKLPEYVDAFKLISRTYGVDESHAEFNLSRFAQILSHRSLQEVSHEDIVHLITRFVSDLEGSPHQWHVAIWLNGLWTKEPEITLSEGLKIRQPTQSDFEIEKPFDPTPLALDPQPLAGLGQPTAILEMRKRAKGQPELALDIENLMATLRLFRVGSVASLRSFWNSDSVTGFGSFRMGPLLSIIPGDKYQVSESDLDSLLKFLDRVRPLIPQEIVRGGETTDDLVTSIQRFNDAMLKPEPPESRIAFSIMSLEALYLKSGEHAELEHRLSQRVSKMLGILGHEPMEVYNRMRQSYDIRSKFVHGEPLKKEDRQYAAENLSKILEYSRASIVTWLQLREKTTKEQFLNLVDNSLLSPGAHTKLTERIKETCTAQ